MLDPELLKVLRCLDNGSPLSLATDAQLLAINEQIKQRQLKNDAGQTLEEPLPCALIREDGQLLYPVVDGIPKLLREEAIRLPEPASTNDG